MEYQGVGFDVTDLKQAEELLLESTRRARDSAEQARAPPAEREAAERAPRRPGRWRSSTAGSPWRWTTASATTWPGC